MKTKFTLITFFLISITSLSVLGGPNPQTNTWIQFISGKYHQKRVEAFQTAYRFLGTGKYRKAAAQNRKSLSHTHKFNFASYNNYAVSVARYKRFDQAIGLLKKSIKSNGIRDYAHFNIFMVNMNAKRYVEAAKWLDSLSYSLRSSYPEPVGTCLLLNQRYHEAFAALHTYISTDSSNVDHETYYNASLAAYMIQDTIHAAEYILAATELKSNDIQYQLHKGKVFLNIDHELSLQAFKKANNLDPKNNQALIGLGYAYILNGKNKEAVKLFSNMLENGQRKNPVVLQALAIAYGNVGENDLALGQMRELNKLREYNVMDLQIMGDLWLNQDSVVKALSYYDRSLALKYTPEASFGKAVAHFLLDEPKKCIEIMNGIESRYPGYEFSPYQSFVKAMAYYNLGLLDEYNQIMEGAAFGKNREVGNLMIKAMRAIGQYNYELANKYLNKASRLDPTNINIILIRGSLDFQFGNYESAANAFKQGLDIEPNNEELRNIYALVLSELEGRGDEAIREMEKVLAVRQSPRYLNNMSLIYSNVGTKKVKEGHFITCVYFEKAESFLDSALAAGLPLVFEVNKGNFRLSMQDTIGADYFYSKSLSQFSINNKGVVSYLQQNRSQAVSYVEQAIAASMPFVCPIIELNLEKLNNTAGRQYANEAPMLIYLYQIMPAILPDKHQFSYSFSMDPEKAIHHDGDYLVYKTLDGELMEDPNSLPVKGANQLANND